MYKYKLKKERMKSDIGYLKVLNIQIFFKKLGQSEECLAVHSIKLTSWE